MLRRRPFASRETRLFLCDAIDALRKVANYVDGVDLAKFLADELRVSGVERELFVAGEAAKHVPEDLRKRAAHVDWRGLTGLRDVLAHDYFGIETETLFEIACNDAPRARAGLEALLALVDGD